jgi:hypothetical protein
VDQDFVIAVSPRHSVRLAAEYATLIAKPPRRDFSVRTVTKREANGIPLMKAEIVIAGEDARRELELAQKYPLHFKKTYFPARLHGDPRVEFDRQLDASRLINVFPPIGCTDDTFRACMIPGQPFTQLLPFQSEPEERNLRHARDLPLTAAAGQWKLAEAAYTELTTLQRGGVAHGDAELHNFVVCPAPLEILLVDFEASVKKDDLDEEAWIARCQSDLDPLLRLAVLVQCALGAQSGDLAERARERAPALFRDPGKFLREIDQQSDLGG